MKGRVARAGTVVLLASALIGGGAVSAVAATGSATTSTGTMSYSLPDSVTLNGMENIQIPISLTASAMQGATYIQVKVAPQGSTKGLTPYYFLTPSLNGNGDAFYAWTDRNVAGVAAGYLFLSPNALYGGVTSLTVTGVAGARNSTEAVPLSASTIAIVQNPTTLRFAPLERNRGGQVKVEVTASAATANGVVDGEGDFKLYTKRPGEKRFVLEQESTSASVAGFTDTLKRGTQIKAVFTRCLFCTPATATARVR